MDSDSHLQLDDVHQERNENPTKKKVKYKDESRTPDGGYKIKTYYPTLEEMRDFNSYIKHIHEDGGHRAGLAKIVPPVGFVPRKSGYDDESLYNMEITCPIRQEVSGEGGLYQQMNIVDKKKMAVRQFKILSEQKHPTPLHIDQASLDRIFWKNVFTNPSIYGADVPGSLFDNDCNEFNLTRLNTILDDIEGDYGVTIQGVNTTYLYFGMWKSSFCWHTEDMDLYSINYLHTGAPKSWYCIAPEYGRRFERLAESFFPHSFKSCKAFLRHKTTLISPQVLKKYSIPFSRCTQEAGQFMITFPYSYHSGYNNGFNIAEATNFASEYWIEFGKWATRCECSAESVKISMQTFVKRYQADRYDLWIRGKDVCKDPRDPKHVAPAPKPTEHDLYVMGVHERLGDESFLNEEDDKKKVAFQQNLSSNLKGKSKSHKNRSIKDTYQRYNDFLNGTKQNHPTSKSDLPHYSPIAVEMVPSTDYEPVRSCDNYKSCSIVKPPNYDRLIKESKPPKISKEDKMKLKKEEKIMKLKEKRAKDRIIASQELLQFLPVTFTHEKKFNRCIAALPPHCSVCQLLVAHPKDNKDIWGSKLPLDVDKGYQEPMNYNNIEQASSSLDTKSLADSPQSLEFKLPEKSGIILPRSAFRDHGWTYGEDEPARLTPENQPRKKRATQSSRAQNGSSLLSIEDSQVENVDGLNQSQVDVLSLEQPPVMTVAIPKEADSGYEERINFMNIDIEENSDLLQCSVCMLAVHKICYGVETMPEFKKDWICDRCLEPNRSAVGCILCPCRGGALKSVNGVWVHISCALTMENVKLSDLTSSDCKRQNFQLPEMTERASCVYCVKNSNLSKYVLGKCVPCAGDGVNKCKNIFHPTCGHRNGGFFEVIDHHIDPKMSRSIIATCAECYNKIEEQYQAIRASESDEELDSDPINIGSRVIALNKNGNFREGTVQNHAPKTTFDVFFPKSNETDVRIPERNIVNLDRVKNFQVGDKIRVKNRPGEETVGKFRRRRNDESEYLIKFDRMALAERVRRKNIYLNIDQMSEQQIEDYIGSATKRLSEEDVTTAVEPVTTVD